MTFVSRTMTILSLKQCFQSFKSGVFFLLIVTFMTMPSAIQAASSEDNPTITPILLPETPNDSFVYQLENRADPFEPFITEKAASSNIDMNEIIDPDIDLTGMQLFEPGQLNLVALMQVGIEDIAMVEDFTGKGYILTKGTKIGRRGIVKDIASNTVIIEETAETRAGKKIITKVVMILKKEGDE